MSDDLLSHFSNNIRRTEIFFRITKSQLTDLYGEYEEYESIRDAASGLSPEGPKIVNHDESARREEERPYLVLDGREPHEFRECHLLNAYSFPHQHLKRDLTPQNFNAFRNRDGALIVVYCNDERKSREMCKVLVDRGTENIFLLTGGFLEFAAEFPSFVEGTLPEGLVLPVTKNTRLTKGALSRINEHETLKHMRESMKQSASGFGSPSARTGRSSRSRLPLTSRTRRSGGGSETGRSTQSTMSVAESVISRSASRKGTGRIYH